MLPSRRWLQTLPSYGDVPAEVSYLVEQLLHCYDGRAPSDDVTERVTKRVTERVTKQATERANDHQFISAKVCFESVFSCEASYIWLLFGKKENPKCLKKYFLEFWKDDFDRKQTTFMAFK